MKKKESILDVLKNGTQEKDRNTIVVKNGNFRADFADGHDVKWFAEKLKKFDRKVKNVCEYGCEKGLSELRKQNDTAIKLAELIKHPEDCVRYFRLYKIATHAPHELQPYVFENAKEFMRENGEKFSAECDFYLAAIIPPKYIAGWENVDVHGFGLEYAVEDLTPCDWLKIGTKVVIKSSRKEGVIVAYKPLQKLHVHYTWYNTRITARSGKYFAGYVVQYGSNSWQKEDCLFNDIKLLPVEVSMKNEHAMAV